MRCRARGRVSLPSAIRMLLRRFRLPARRPGIHVFSRKDSAVAIKYAANGDPWPVFDKEGIDQYGRRREWYAVHGAEHGWEDVAQAFAAEDGESIAADAEELPPRVHDLKEEWVKYGIARGGNPAEVEAMTKDELITLYGTP